MAVTNIRDLVSVAPWRAKLLPGHFAGKLFHTEAGSRESGRRIVTHEFPKKELPYSEDMGKKATEFSVRGYIIQFVADTATPLYKRDYTIARDILQKRLDLGQAGTLQLPMQEPMTVVCSRYRMTEEDRFGGYVTFDMTFVELGAPPFTPQPDAASNLVTQSQQLRAEVISSLTPQGPDRPPALPGRIVSPAPAPAAAAPSGSALRLSRR